MPNKTEWAMFVAAIVIIAGFFAIGHCQDTKPEGQGNVPVATPKGNLPYTDAGANSPNSAKKPVHQRAKAPQDPQAPPNKLVFPQDIKNGISKIREEHTQALTAAKRRAIYDSEAARWKAYEKTHPTATQANPGLPNEGLHELVTVPAVRKKIGDTPHWTCDDPKALHVVTEAGEHVCVK